mmetsp:Transcript_5963/g.9542  ORF Transcript_5963/g.9542 Transcript_5963/m.9542 type:complete len:231 (+) Transcript_5963:108-800(+)
MRRVQSHKVKPQLLGRSRSSQPPLTSVADVLGPWHFWKNALTGSPPPRAVTSHSESKGHVPHLIHLHSLHYLSKRVTGQHPPKCHEVLAPPHSRCIGRSSFKSIVVVTRGTEDRSVVAHRTRGPREKTQRVGRDLKIVFEHDHELVLLRKCVLQHKSVVICKFRTQDRAPFHIRRFGWQAHQPHGVKFTNHHLHASMRAILIDCDTRHVGARRALHGPQQPPQRLRSVMR